VLNYFRIRTKLGDNMANWSSAAAGGTAGALGGAASGATIGSVIPGLGTGVGAIIGALLGLAGGSIPGLAESDKPGQRQGNIATGYNAQNTQLSNRNPLQQNAMDQLVQQGLANSNFQGIEDRARKDFATKTIPLLSERFSAFGGSGTRTSGGFENRLGQSGADLESQLAALRGQYGMQQLGLGLQPQFENIYQPEQEGFAQGIAGDAPKYLELLAKLFSESNQNKLGGGA
jgi:hypothetical protein